VIKAVIFDIDGVLIRPWGFRDALIRERGITPEMTAPFFGGAFIDCIEGRADLFETLPPFLPSWGWPGTASEFVTEWFATENTPNEPVLEIVGELRRHLPCHIASNQERHRARFIATEMGFDRQFDRLFFSSDLGSGKPSEEFYATVAVRLERAGDELLFFDDVEANVKAARRAGWHAERFTTVAQLKADIARHTGVRLA
jgi:putative hydrolase of the HAD superfamily